MSELCEKEITDLAMATLCKRRDFGYSSWSMWCGTEVDGLFGIPDLVLAFIRKNSSQTFIHTISIEVKISNWRRALNQAYKYRSFSNYAYVLMDSNYVHRPLKHLELFKRSNIGLASINPLGDIVKYNTPRIQTPYTTQLKKKLSSIVTRSLESDELEAHETPFDEYRYIPS